MPLNTQSEPDHSLNLWIWGAAVGGALLGIASLLYQAGYFSNPKKKLNSKQSRPPKFLKALEEPIHEPALVLSKTKRLKALDAPSAIITPQRKKSRILTSGTIHLRIGCSSKKGSSKAEIFLNSPPEAIAALRPLTLIESIVDKVVEASPQSPSLASFSSEELESPESPHPILDKAPHVFVKPVILSAESIPHSMKSVLDISSKLMYFIQDEALRIVSFTKPRKEGEINTSMIQIHVPVKLSRERKRILFTSFQDFFKKHLLESASFEQHGHPISDKEKSLYLCKISSTESIKKMEPALLCLQYILNFTKALQFSVVGSRAARFVSNPTDSASCSRDYDCTLFVQLKEGADLIPCGSSLGYIFKKMSLKMTDSFDLGKKMQVGESFWYFNALRDPEHQVELKISVDYLEIDSMIAASRKLRHLTVKAAQILIPTPPIQQDAFAIKEFHGQQYYYKSKKLDFTKEAVSVGPEAIAYALAYCMLQVQKEKKLFLRPRLVELMLQNIIASSDIETLKEQAFYQFNKKSLKHSEAAASGAGAPSVEERTFQAVLDLLNAKHQGMPTPERK
ncbi:MAG: hypothetical protein NTV32_09925 [Gammaproteobacteria bacterium]|nr:hypothetical protein [Gammaproteobacteria bacterium]